MKTISLPEDIHRSLIELKLKEGNKTAADLIEKLIIEYQKKRLHDFSVKFKKSLKEKGMTIEEFLKESDKIREELADEWYPE
jgi:predicted CopG family antitoxin|tara:strand:+ start:220 stop:465 length:246 start_codon:yes stop_codon:yes gene_type:complete